MLAFEKVIGRRCFRLLVCCLVDAYFLKRRARETARADFLLAAVAVGSPTRPWSLSTSGDAIPVREAARCTERLLAVSAGKKLINAQRGLQVYSRGENRLNKTHRGIISRTEMLRDITARASGHDPR